MKNHRFSLLSILLFVVSCLSVKVGFSQTSEEVIWEEIFSESDGTYVEIAKSSYISFNENIDVDNSLWEVVNYDFVGSNLNGHAIFKTEAIDIHAYEDVSISIDIVGTGDMESSDYLNLYYRLDNGTKVALTNGLNNDSFSLKQATASNLNGHWLEIIIESYNSETSEVYAVDNIVVKGTPITVEPANIWNENFDDLADGAMVDNGTTSWSLDASATNLSSGRFDVRYGRFEGVNLDGLSKWASEVIDISDFEDVSIEMDSYVFGYNEYADCMYIYYKLDGGSNKVLTKGVIGGNTTEGDWTVDPVLSSAYNINGSTLQIFVEMSNDTDNERFSIDNIRVSGTAINVNVSLDANQLTCSETEVTINTTSSVSGLDYTWTGPNGFTSTDQNPIVDEIGTYTLTVRNGNGDVVATESILIESDIIAPTAIATGGTLTCATSISLAVTTDASDPLFEWTGPGGFTSTLSNPVASVSGTYSVTVTDQTSGCSNTADAIVVVGSGPSGEIIWEETFTDSEGKYIEIANSSYISFNENIDKDNSLWEVYDNRFVGNELLGQAIFKTEAVNIHAYEDVSVTIDIKSHGDMEDDDYLNIYYRLDNGPMIALENGLNVNTFQEKQAAVCGLNGRWVEIIVECYNSHSNEYYKLDNIVVRGTPVAIEPANVWDENFDDLAGGTTVDTGETAWTREVSSTNLTDGYFDSRYDRFEGVNLDSKSTWTSEEIDISSYQDISIEMDAYGFGYIEDDDYMNIYYKLDGGTEVLLENGDLRGNPSPAWTLDPVLCTASGLNGSTLQLIVEMKNHTDNERWYIDNIRVSGADAAVEISLQVDEITCLYQSVVINTTASQSGLTYSWEGPNGFTSSDQDPTVSEAGTYNVTVTNGGGTIVATESILVEANVALPTVTTTVDGELTCTDGEVVISASSSISGVTYSWTGPDEFLSVEREPTVSEPGTYIVTVTDPSNGCENTAEAIVEESVEELAVSTIGGTLTCLVEEFNLVAVASLTGVSYNWTGPNGFTSIDQNPLVSESGTYTVIVTKGECSATAEVVVLEDFDAPSVTATGGTITCSESEVALTATSEAGVEYSWTGPNGFSSTEQNPTVSESGTYTVTVTSPGNSCTSTAEAIVIEDAELPSASATGGTLTCDVTEITLTSTTDTGVSFAWTGPNGFTSADQNPVVSAAGTYEVTITSANGCESVASAEVEEDAGLPSASATGGTLTCDVTEITLTSSTDTGVSFVWTGPNGFTSADQNPVVSTAGTYEVTITSANGCESVASAEVLEDAGLPSASATGGTLTCNVTEITLTSSTDTGVSFAWTGPNGFTSADQNPVVSAAGTYEVTITSANGCESVASAEVEEDITAPSASATGGTLTCDVTEVTLTSSSTTSGVVFNWSGPGGFSSTLQNPIVNESGTYTVTVTDQSNGCETTAEAIVDESLDGLTVAAIGGTLTCLVEEFNVIAVASLTDVSYSWSGPNGFTSTDQNPIVSEAGTYTITVTSAGGCVASAEAEVIEDIDAPSLSALGGTLTCDVTAVSLTATSDAGVDYVWAGPNGFSSTESSPSVSTAGTYTVTVTNPVNGCISSTIVEVLEDITAPSASATGGTLTCDVTEITLTSSTDTGVSFVWTGPNGFTSADQNPVVSTAGTYEVTITSANGCESVASAEVLEDAGLPSASATGGTLTCNVTEITLTSSTDTGVSFAWTGPNGFTSADQNPVVSAAGTYEVTITSANGCESVASAEVLEDAGLPSASATGGTLTCNVTEITLTSSTDTGVSFAWTGPNGFTSADQNPVVSVTGTYEVTITSANGCESVASAEVAEDAGLPSASATGGTLTCDVTEITLTSSTDTGVSFAWTGPNGFTSADQNPVVSAAGTYEVTITSANGCESVASAEVLEDIIVPDVVATGGSLSCTITEITLIANSTTSGVSFSWTGPNGFSSTEQNPTVNESGTYTITVTSSNGCENTAEAIVEESVEELAVSTIGGTLTCLVEEFNLVAVASLTGVSYNWTGPNGFTSIDQNPLVSESGTYTVIVTKGECSATAEVVVLEDFDAPSVTATGGTITCSESEVALTATSEAGVEYSWAGPNGFSSTEQNPTVSESGTYTVTVTSPGNSCTSTAEAIVIEDAELPSASATGGTLTCDVTEITLTSTTDTGVSFAWTGPNGFTSADQNPVVSAAGTYEVTITSANGCESVASAEVEEDAGLPSASATGGTLTCDITEITLTSSTNTGVSFAWTGPNGFTSVDQNPVVSAAGTYEVTITSANGCESVASAEVVEDAGLPSASATGGTLTCDVTEITLTSTTDTGVSFAWTGPNGFTSADQNPVVSAAGTYEVTITSANGCESVASAEVLEDAGLPSASATGGTLTCNVTEITLTSSTDTGVSFAWTGPNGFTSADQNPVVSVTGTYEVTITSANGCESVASAEVAEDAGLPSASATGGTLTCDVTEITLTSSTDTGVSFAWTGPNGFTSADQNPVVSAAGTYEVTITSANGCESVASAEVAEDIIVPDVVATGGSLSCTITEITLIANSTTSGVSFLWTGPNGFSSTEQNPTVNESGTYTITVTSSNGCENTAEAIVEESVEELAVSTIGGTLTCLVEEFNLVAVASLTGVSYNWTGPNGFTSTDQNPLVSESGTYTVIVVKGECSATAEVVVLEDFDAPSVTATGGTITCSESEVALTATSEAGVEYSWAGPNGFSSTEQNPTVSESGTYTVTVTSPGNSCTSTAEAIVIEDAELPSASATGGTLTCDVTEITLTSSTDTGVSFAWTGPNGFTSADQNPVVSAAGTYEVTITSANGCESVASAEVVEDAGLPSASATGGTLTCDITEITLTSSTDTGVSFAWTGPNGFTSADQNPVVSAAGTYEVTITSSNGCESVASAEVLEDAGLPSASATGGTLTCDVTEIILISSTDTGVSFAWTGPNGFTSADQNPVVSAAGTYEVTITSANGCESVASAEVVEDAGLPSASATGGTLTCDVTEITLTSSTDTGVSFAWTGPNGFTSADQNPVVSATGTYTVTITSANGCESVASAEVVEDAGLPSASATGGTLTCDVTEITLTSSTDTGISFAWTGPNGFTSADQNPVVSAAGTYEVTITSANGCESVASAEVVEDAGLPSASATGGTLTCDVTEITLTSSTDTGVSFAWTGPNGFTSADQNPVVSAAGTYEVTITSANGCESVASAEVVEDARLPSASATGGTLTCDVTEITLTSSTDTGVSFAWTGPNGFTSADQNPVVSAAGTYEVTITSANGCESAASAEVVEDAGLPSASATGGTLTCDVTEITLTSSTDTGVSFAWTGPNGFTSADQNPVVSAAGTYEVTITSANGCESVASAEVLEDAGLPSASATGGTLTCDVTEITLTSSTDTGVSFAWTGPNGFTSADQNPVVSAAGTYEVTITSANGCESVASAEVLEDAGLPSASATGGTLTCDVTEITLTSSTDTGVSFAWTGPNGFTSADQNPVVSAAGTYTVTITSANGCESVASAEVLEDIIVPDVVATGGSLSCTITEITLIANSTTSGVNFSWTGPNGFSSTEQNPTVSESGTYTITVTSSNGCENTAEAIVEESVEELAVSTIGGTLTCLVEEFNLVAVASLTGVSYNWTGPNGFTSTDQNPLVSESGTYTVIVVKGECSATAEVVVLEDFDAPSVTATGGTITCSESEVALTATSEAGVEYSWAGPNGFSSTEQNPMVSESGTYTVTVTSPGNSCTSTAEAIVIEDAELPSASATGGTLTCDVTEVTLTSSTDTGVSFAWTGPNGFTSADQNPVVSSAGTYEVTITSANGCESVASTEVVEDAGLPSASATGGTLTCDVTEITLTSSTDTGVSFAWTGPNGFTSADQNPVVSAAGTYEVTITSANGCESVASAEVLEDAGLPSASATGGTLTCDVTEITLTSSTDTGVSFAWAGPNGFTSADQNPVVSAAGTYEVTITSANGCESVASAEVLEDAGLPTASATGGTLTCDVTEITLTSSTDTGVSFAWTGPNGFTSADQNPVVSAAGTYEVTITSANGCESVASAEVLEDAGLPSASATGGTLTCDVTEITLTSSTDTGVSFAWAGPNGFTSADQNPVVSAAGTYEVTITSANGCESVASAEVLEDAGLPTASATGGTLTCDVTEITLTSSTDTGVSFAWTGPNGFTSADQNPVISAAGTYEVTITSANGCESVASAEVLEDAGLPTASATGGTLTCDVTEITLTSSTDTGVSFAWTGPNGFTSADQNPVVSSAGTYEVTITSANGCESVASAEVLEDAGLPTASATGGTLTCDVTEITLTSSTDTGVSFAWTGPNGFTSADQNPVVSAAGTYEVTITSANGCESVASAEVLEDAGLPTASATGGTLTCDVTEITLTSSTDTGVSFAWTGPNGFTSADQNPVISAAGTYEVTITSANGCESVASAEVLEDAGLPTASATGGTLTCDVTEITLTSSTDTGVSFAWTGPNGFTSADQNPVISAAGTYEVTITSANGCESVASAEVLEDAGLPTASATGGTLTCDVTEITLTSSTDTGVSFAWTGPNGFTSADQNPVVSAAGTYEVTITSANGCESVASAEVVEDAGLPSASATGGTLTCDVTEITLTSSTDTGVSFAWTGPNGFTSADQNPVVSAAGTYEVTITSANGCESVASAEVVEDAGLPSASATGGTLTCDVTEITLTSSTDTGVSFAWTGPNGFTSADQNPVVSAAGTYEVTITSANGCESVASAEVVEDAGLPSASATGGTLTCDVTEITLTSSTDTGVSFAWTGPNGFTSADQNPVVSAAGTYEVTITSANGCESVASAEVVEDAGLPSASATGGTLTCDVTEITLTSSTDTGVSFAWTGPNGFTSADQNPVVSAAGTYEVTITSANGCESVASAEVVEDAGLPSASATGGTLTCDVTEITLTSSTDTGVSFAWTGPNGFTSADQNPVVSAAGTYEVTITSANGCESVASAEVVEDAGLPSASATGGTLTCDVTEITLTSSTDTGVSFAWTGPNGFTSADQNPVVSAAGTYEVTITSANGCESVASAEVVEDAGLPSASATGGTLTCDVTEITLTSSTDTGVSFAWTGPNGFTSADQNPVVSAAGTYEVTITSANGCESVASAEVVEDAGLPSASATGGTLTCDITEITLTSSTDTGVSFAWTGPNGFTSADQNPVVSAAGTYEVTITSANGCESVASAEVLEDAGLPSASATGGTLTCDVTEITLTSSTDTGVSFAWTGPNGFTSADQNPVVSAAGTYEVTITSANGCESVASAEVVEDAGLPSASATGGTLTCDVTEITLTSSTDTGVSFAWTGPNGFTSADQNPVVSAAGTYEVTITSANGCESVASAEVVEDAGLPSASATGGTLTCDITEITLTSSTDTGVSFAWTGPNGFTSADQNPVVSAAGTYEVTITSANGCESVASAEVLEDAGLPSASATGGTLTCDVTEITLTSSTDTGVSFAWTGPNGFTSADQNPVVSAAGTYEVTITSANGCESVASAEVVEDAGLPSASATGGTLTCDVTEITLTSSTDTGVSFAWTGPNGFTSADQNPVVSAAGTYEVTITSANGCESVASAEVVEDAGLPSASATGGTLTCDVTEITLTSSTDTGISFAWTGPNGFTSADQNPVVSAAGTYEVTITSANGCESVASAEVLEDAGLPTASATGGTLTCDVTEITLTSTTDTGVSFAWTGPNGFTSAAQNPVVSAAGTYEVTITSANGCESVASAEVDVIEDLTVEVIGGSLTCLVEEFNIIAVASSNNVSYSWTGPNGFVSTDQNPLVSNPGTYTITVTSLSGRCEASKEVIVVEDLTVPNLTTESGTLTCTINEVALAAISDEGVEYLWTGPNGFASEEQNLTVSEAGSYTVIVTNPSSGCFTSETIIVEEDIESPSLEVSGGTLTCDVTEITLTATTDTGISFSWEGPNGFSSTEQNPVVNEAGVYTAVVTAANGCENTISTEVTEDTTSPSADATGGTLTCDVTEITLTATTDIGTSFNWTGPNGYTSSEQNPVVGEAGIYTVTITSENGCENTASAEVDELNEVLTVAVIGGSLTCLVEEFNIIAVASSNNVSYSWTGPNGFSSTLQNPLISESGRYIVTVTSLVSGCEAVAETTVEERDDAVNLSVEGGNLTCDVSEVALTAISDEGVEYAWTGPNGFASSDQNLSVSVAGAYTVVVTDPSSGCSAEETVIVEEDTATPSLEIIGGTLTCAITEVELNAITDTDANFNWEGPNGFASTDQNPLVSEPGTYSVTVTALNGCQNSAEVVIEEEILDITVFLIGGTLSCTVEEFSIIAVSTLADAIYSWVGPDGFTSTLQNPLVSEPGIYTVVVTDPISGCSEQASTEILRDVNPPNCLIEADLASQSLSVEAIDNGTYTWFVDNPDWTIVSGQNTPSIELAGGEQGSVVNVSVSVTDNSTDCESSCSIDLQIIDGELIDITETGAFDVVDVENIQTTIVQSLSMQVYPNPISTEGTVSFSSTTDANATITLYAVDGTSTQELFSGAIAANEVIEVPIDARSFSSGAYICTMVAGDQMVDQIIIIE